MGELSSAVRPTVLLVDDDPDVCDATAQMLATRGFRVLTASDQKSALDLLDENRGEVSVVVADLSLPGDTRGQLARALSAAHPYVKIVYATGIPRHIALATGLVHPDAPYLEKPVAPDVLAGVVRSLGNRAGGVSARDSAEDW